MARECRAGEREQSMEDKAATFHLVKTKLNTYLTLQAKNTCAFPFRSLFEKKTKKRYRRATADKVGK
jgi:hypothetical protein